MTPTRPSPDDPRFQPGAPEHVTAAEARALKPRATYVRLTPECWDMIGAAYMNGATAKQLAVKWKVSPTSIYRHASETGCTKTARSRRIAAEAKARATEAAERPPPSPPEPEPLDPLLTADEVAALALAAVARCLNTGRYAEAERLGRLAEGLSRLAAPPRPLSPPPASFVPDADPATAGMTADELRAEIEPRLDLVAQRLLARHAARC